MNMARMLLAILICVALATCENNQTQNTEVEAPPAEIAPAEEAPAPPQVEVSKVVPNHQPLFNYIDVNRDGCMTEEEWSTAGAPMSSFNGLVKDGCVKPEYMTGGPDGIDINGDGFFTIEEFMEFDRRFANLEPAPPRGEIRKEKPNHQPLFNAIDSNKDGCMTEEEWKAAGAPMSSFNGLVQDGCVTPEHMMASQAPEGIDLNNDGFFTIEEFKAFDKKMSTQMSAGGGPGGAEAPPASGN